MPLPARIMVIVVTVCVMAAAVMIVGETLRSSRSDHDEQGRYPSPTSTRKPVTDLRHAESRGGMPVFAAAMVPGTSRKGSHSRSLNQYYERRAYAGAPPAIPHPVDSYMNRSQRCNVCHERGGFAPKFNAYTPITPHPQYTNCLQCHVAVTEETRFVDTDWTSVPAPAIQRSALPGSPPPIPHGLQLRDNCLACHAGPAAPPKIRTSHPERENCRQCHVPKATQTLFDRASASE